MRRTLSYARFPRIPAPNDAWPFSSLGLTSTHSSMRASHHPPPVRNVSSRGRPLHTTPPARRGPMIPIRIQKPGTAEPPDWDGAKSAGHDTASHPNPSPDPPLPEPTLPGGTGFRPEPEQGREKPKGRLRKVTGFVADAIIFVLVAEFVIQCVERLQAGGGGGGGGGDGRDPKTTLNPTTFVPFTITAREQVSPTAFVLTAEPPAASALSNAEVVAAAWEHGLWSVEVKQPQLQVAREYTPLPFLPPTSPSSPSAASSALASPSSSEDEMKRPRDEDGDGPGREREREEGAKLLLRFYIRRLDGGEVSRYLSRLEVGDALELRGPRLGFDVCARAGVERAQPGVPDLSQHEQSQTADEKVKGKGQVKKKRVVFLAGGTGIAPALQAAQALLGASASGGRGSVEMDVVWANRRREDCVGCDDDAAAVGRPDSPVVALLEDFRRRYPGRFRYSCAVDEEGSYIDAGTVARLTGASASAPVSAQPRPWRTGPGWRFLLWAPADSGTETTTSNIRTASPSTTTLNSDACAYHSARSLVTSDDQDAAERGPCRCADGAGNPAAAGAESGKNLLMVSGPDGFVAHYVGAKVWAGGRELQGPVGGVVGELRRRYPALGEDWLVLKT